MGAYWPSLLPQALLTGSLLGVLSCGLGLKWSARWLAFIGLASGFAALSASRLGGPATGQMSLGSTGRLTPAAAAGAFLMLSAALFKIGAFPLNFWLPDAYEAAPPELAGFMSTSIKAGGFLLLARLLTLAGGGNAQGL